MGELGLVTPLALLFLLVTVGLTEKGYGAVWGLVGPPALIGLVAYAMAVFARLWSGRWICVLVLAGLVVGQVFVFWLCSATFSSASFRNPIALIVLGPALYAFLLEWRVLRSCAAPRRRRLR